MTVFREGKHFNSIWKERRRFFTKHRDIEICVGLGSHFNRLCEGLRLESEVASLIESPQHLSNDTMMQELGVKGQQYKNT